MKTKKEVKEAIKEALSIHRPVVSRLSGPKNGYFVKVDEYTINAKKLFDLADKLGTMNIDLNSYASSGCPTCGVDSEISLTIWWD